MQKPYFFTTMTPWVRKIPKDDTGVHIIGKSLEFSDMLRIPLYKITKDRIKKVIQYTYMDIPKELDKKFFSQLSHLIMAHVYIEKLTLNWYNFVKCIVINNKEHICENLGLTTDKFNMFFFKGYIILKELKLDMTPLPSGKFKPTFENFLKLDLDYIEI